MGSWVSIPVTNNNKYNVSLAPCTFLGQLQQVKAVYPVDVGQASGSENAAKTVSMNENVTNRVKAPKKLNHKHRQTDTQMHDSFLQTKVHEVLKWS